MARMNLGGEVKRKLSLSGENRQRVVFSIDQGKKPPKSRVWENLPSLVLDLILQKLDTPRDYSRFMMVSRTWLEVGRRQLPRHLRMLVIQRSTTYDVPYPVCTTRFEFYLAIKHNFIAVPSKLPFVFYPKTRIIGCFSSERLILYDPLRFLIQLHDPTGPSSSSRCEDEICVEKLIGHHHLEQHHPIKAVLSSSDQEKDPFPLQRFVLALLYRSIFSHRSCILLLYGLESSFVYGLESSSGDDRLLCPPILDVVRFANGKIAWLNQLGQIGITNGNGNGNGPSVTWLIPTSPLDIPIHNSCKYIVERASGGRGKSTSLWLVVIVLHLSWNNETTVNVFNGEVEEEKGLVEWQKATSLDNEIIFLSAASSFAICNPNNNPAMGLIPNTIYFFDENCRYYSRGLQIFDVECNRLIVQQKLASEYHPEYPPCWVYSEALQWASEICSVFY